MIRMIIASAVFSVAAAAVLPEDAQAQIVEYVNNIDENGNYNFRFETSNGIKREETGDVINIGQEDQYIEVHGSYSYIDTNGEVVNIRYRADKDGYHTEDEEEYIIRPPSLPAAAVATLLGK